MFLRELEKRPMSFLKLLEFHATDYEGLKERGYVAWRRNEQAMHLTRLVITLEGWLALSKLE